MFGYLTADVGQMQKEEKAEYKAHYCGLCHVLGEKYGKTGMAALSYDMAFLEMLLADLTDSKAEEGMEKCVTHPLKAHRYVCTGCTEYAADMQMLLAYYAAYDDAEDEGKKQKLQKLGRFLPELREEYPRQDEAIVSALKRIREEEKKSTKDPELMARLSGSMISEVFAMDPESFFADDLRALGFGLGRFIYLMDGWCDRKKDSKKGSYNPFSSDARWEDVKEMLIDAAADAGSAFERLPLDQHVPILRNIIYSGIWMRTRREEKNGDD